MGIVTIPLTKGLSAIIDAEDAPLVSGSKWRASQAGRKWYAAATRGGRTVYLHRLLMKAPKGVLVDHRDNDGLNNQRSNLRLANKSLNGANSALSVRNKSGFKGVHRIRGNKWRASITHQGKIRNLGHYDTAEKAFEAYKIAAREAHGEFANPVSGREDGKSLCLYVPNRGI